MQIKRFVAATAAVGGLGLVLTATTQVAHGARAKTRDVQVATGVARASPAGVLYRIGGDGLGSYVSTSDGLVTSILQGTTGEWSLDTYALATVRGKAVVKPSGRTATFDFSEPTADNTARYPFAGTTVTAPVHLIAKSRLAPASTTFVAIPAGATVQSPGAFRFEVGNDASGTAYRLAFQPENYAEVTRMAITCDAADGSGCRAWTITPGAAADGTTYTGTDGLPRSRNKLLRIDRSTDAVLEDLGDYYMSFCLHVTR